MNKRINESIKPIEPVYDAPIAMWKLSTSSESGEIERTRYRKSNRKALEEDNSEELIAAINDEVNQNKLEPESNNADFSDTVKTESLDIF